MMDLFRPSVRGKAPAKSWTLLPMTWRTDDLWVFRMMRWHHVLLDGWSSTSNVRRRIGSWVVEVPYLWGWWMKHCKFVWLGGGNSKIFYFPTLAGEMIYFDSYFSNGLKQPTRWSFWRISTISTLQKSAWSLGWPLFWETFMVAVMRNHPRWVG